MLARHVRISPPKDKHSYTVCVRARARVCVLQNIVVVVVVVVLSCTGIPRVGGAG